MKLNAEHFGITIKPFAEWWHHPIFSQKGIWFYLTGQLTTFWQGEFFWENQPLILPGSTTLYTIFSLGLLAVAFSGLHPTTNPDPWQRRALGLAAACFIGILGFFALLSVIYNFDQCPNPSRDYPYFHQGRLMLGALIPFLLLIVYGLDRLLYRVGTKTKFLVLGAIIAAMLTSEIVVDWPAFSNPFNWFHLP